jgi:hypothetical protein
MSYREQYNARMQKLARRAFADHTIRTAQKDRWLIQRCRSDGSWDSCYATEVICLWNRALFVGGDIDVVVFAYGPTEYEQRLRWIGRQHGSTSYLREKAMIGTGKGVVLEWNDDCAASDLQEALEDEDLELTENEQLDIQSAKDRVGDGEHAVWEELSPRSWDTMEYFQDLGEVISPRVFYAQAAVEKLCELLELFSEEKKELAIQPPMTFENLGRQGHLNRWDEASAKLGVEVHVSVTFMEPDTSAPYNMVFVDGERVSNLPIEEFERALDSTDRGRYESIIERLKQDRERFVRS